MRPIIILTVQRDRLTPALQRLGSALSGGRREEVHFEMAQELLTLTQEQFGSDRPNRPAPWKPLSPKYQKQIGYFGPPKLILSGDLQSGFSVAATPEMGVVTAHTGYAAAHQYGTRIVPPRPYFPVVDGKLTDYAARRIAKRAEDTIAKIVNE